MQSLKEYVFSLMIISISCAAVNILTPENGNTSKYVHFIAALVVSVVLLSPIQSLVGVLPDIFDEGYTVPAYAENENEEFYTQNIVSETLSNIEDSLREELENRFKRQVFDIEIECDSSETDNVIIKKVTVIFEEYDKYLYSDTINYTRELLGCECEVKSRKDAEK